MVVTGFPLAEQVVDFSARLGKLDKLTYAFIINCNASRPDIFDSAPEICRPTRISALCCLPAHDFRTELLVPGILTGRSRIITAVGGSAYLF